MIFTLFTNCLHFLQIIYIVYILSSFFTHSLREERKMNYLPHVHVPAQNVDKVTHRIQNYVIQTLFFVGTTFGI